MKTQLMLDDDNFFIIIPDDLIKDMGWLEDDILNIDFDAAFTKLEISKDEDDEEEILDIEAEQDF